MRPPPISTLFPYPTLSRSSPPHGFCPNAQHILFVDVEIDVDRIKLNDGGELGRRRHANEFSDRDEMRADDAIEWRDDIGIDRKSTRLNSSHSQISYAVFCM